MAMDAVVDERTLREIYLTGFEIAVREGAPRSIMTSYNRVNGEYAHENEYLLKTVLREDWGISRSAPKATLRTWSLEPPQSETTMPSKPQSSRSTVLSRYSFSWAYSPLTRL